MAAHSAGDDFELYAMDRMAAAEAAPVEEHLLVCEGCRERLAECDRYVRAMRTAMRQNENLAVSIVAEGCRERT